MARILINSEWYEQVSASALYEADLEALIMRNANQLFPHFHAIPFKKRVYDQYDAAEPDFALVHRDYNQWWVVEVEMSHHSLHGHVLPQVTVLSRALYDASVADALHQEAPHLDHARLVAMLKGEQPKVLVIVNAPQPAWLEPLHRVNALVTIFEVFRSSSNVHIYRFNGESIPSIVQATSLCGRDPNLPGMMIRVKSPGIFDPPDVEQLRLKWDGGISEWTKIEVADGVWLLPKGPAPLTKASKFKLLRHENGEYELMEWG